MRAKRRRRQFLFADASVRFVGEEIDHWTYQFLGCRYDRAVIDVP